ncbi:MAG: pirin family protein [Acidobacteria bacterium]|nr:MAG: pirin family protein [Acidobacteriota bacterium]
MKFRSVSQVVFAPAHQMGPLTVRQLLPSEELPYLDPFVLLHHAPPKDFSGGAGVSWHPHRGFAPVTFIFKGGIRHRDTEGNDATVMAGGTQWMHAGSGLLHDETPIPGETELIQLWINSPARHKMDRPSYHPLTPEATPASIGPDRLVTLHVIAGEVSGLKGPIRTLSPINAATIEAKRGGRIDIALPPTHNVFIYLLDGALRFTDGTTVSGLHQVVFSADGDAIHFEALEDAQALLMSGEPIGEAIVSYGPFVMNTEDEIRAAFRDYRNGAMGVVP